MADEVKPWTVQRSDPYGFTYVLDENGKKICTVYGDKERKAQIAEAIASLPVTLAEIARLKERA